MNGMICQSIFRNKRFVAFSSKPSRPATSDVAGVGTCSAVMDMFFSMVSDEDINDEI